jgi:hypothetical protein
MYLLATITCSIRFFTHSAFQPILKLFYSTLIVLCLVRFVAFAISTSLMTSNAYYYKYLLSPQSLSDEEINQIG